MPARITGYTKTASKGPIFGGVKPGHMGIKPGISTGMMSMTSSRKSRPSSALSNHSAKSTQASQAHINHLKPHPHKSYGSKPEVNLTDLNRPAVLVRRHTSYDSTNFVSSHRPDGYHQSTGNQHVRDCYNRNTGMDYTGTSVEAQSALKGHRIERKCEPFRIRPLCAGIPGKAVGVAESFRAPEPFRVRSAKHSSSDSTRSNSSHATASEASSVRPRSASSATDTRGRSASAGSSELPTFSRIIMEKSPNRTIAEKLAAFQFPLHPARKRTMSDGEKSGKSSLVSRMRSRTLSDGAKDHKDQTNKKSEKTVTFEERRRSHTISYSSGETISTN